MAIPIRVLPVIADNIPAELKARDQWVLWAFEEREGKPTKVPYNTHTGRRASCDDPDTWAAFPAALAVYNQSQSNGCRFSGIGYQLAAEDRIFGVDLDKCIDPVTGEVAEWALNIVRRLDSYTERSPSGTGLRIFCLGQLPPGRRRKGAVEMYQEGRFLTTTGNHFDGTPFSVNERTSEIEAIHAELFPPSATEKRQTSGRQSFPAHLTDAEVLDLCRRAQNSAKFDELYRGSASAYGDDESAADAALCSFIAFYTQDAAQIDRLFSGSGLCREKWESRPDYRERTISLALSGLRETYSPPSAQYSGTRLGQSSAPAIAASVAPPPRASDWPEAMDAAAFHGLTGEIINTLEPHTEADSTALLMQFLAAFGNSINRTAYFLAEADRHYGNLFIVLVGMSAKGRKGTSWGYIKKVMALADPIWTEGRVMSGLSSGEGLIWAVRDKIEKEKTDKSGQVEIITVDPGVSDKRLLALESEFASVLRLTERDGNTLSAIVRQAWDSGDLRTLTKNSPAHASGAHVSVIGHVTGDELRRYLTATESANGFANRFLWVCTKRSKLLPEGGNLNEADLDPLIARLRAALAFGRTTTQIKRDEEARAIWRDVYPVLSAGRPGLAGAVTSRAEAQTMRLALLYALLDSSPVIRKEHLMAALAVWQYVEASAKFVFGGSLGDPVADEILRSLQGAPEGKTRTALRDLFGRHQSSERVGLSLELLSQHGLVKCERRDTGGRPEEVWYAT